MWALLRLNIVLVASHSSNGRKSLIALRKNLYKQEKEDILTVTLLLVVNQVWMGSSL
jgi:hypothetical protein